MKFLIPILLGIFLANARANYDSFPTEKDVCDAGEFEIVHQYQREQHVDLRIDWPEMCEWAVRDAKGSFKLQRMCWDLKERCHPDMLPGIDRPRFQGEL